MKQEFEYEMYIQAQKDFQGNVSLSALACDMSEYGYIHVLKHKVKFSVDIPDDFEIGSAEIECIKNEIRKTKANAEFRVNQLEERIQSLLCIEHKEAA